MNIRCIEAGRMWEIKRPYDAPRTELKGRKNGVGGRGMTSAGFRFFLPLVFRWQRSICIWTACSQSLDEWWV